MTVFGTYLHGVFYNAHWTRHFLNEVRVTNGLAPLVNTQISLSEYKDQQYNRLAQLFKENVDLDRFNQILAGEQR